MKIYSYVVARDYGFAPNPFWEICSLATCKPDIRQRAEVGDWIVGTGSATKSKEKHLIYAMEVSEIMNFDQYWNDPRFQLKKPNLNGSHKYQYGDNIYHQVDGNWLQEPSHHTFADGSPSTANINTDTRINRILISNNYLYFGDTAPEIPADLQDLIKTGPGYKNSFSPEFIYKFIKWFNSFESKGFQGRPLDWE